MLLLQANPSWFKYTSAIVSFNTGHLLCIVSLQESIHSGLRYCVWIFSPKLSLLNILEQTTEHFSVVDKLHYYNTCKIRFWFKKLMALVLIFWRVLECFWISLQQWNYLSGPFQYLQQMWHFMNLRFVGLFQIPYVWVQYSHKHSLVSVS